MTTITDTAREAAASAETWTLWASKRPVDTKVAYRWRIPARKICGMVLRPEWTDKLHLCGMGYDPHEWWPGGSRWDGYRRSVPEGLEWRPTLPEETAIYWGGLDLLPCPFTGRQPTVEYSGRWIGAPPYEVESLILKSWLIRSSFWSNAAKLQATWNQRFADKDAAAALTAARRAGAEEMQRRCAMAAASQRLGLCQSSARDQGRNAACVDIEEAIRAIQIEESK